MKDYFKDNPDVKIVDCIYETKNYDIFKKMPGNRDVTKINYLKKSMKENGFMNCPIIVNEDMEVSDGQHRLEAAKALGIPVKFVIQKYVELKETITLNTGQKNWTTKDFLSSIALNNKDFKRFEQLSVLFPQCPYAVIYAAIDNALTGGGIGQKIKRRTLVCTEEQYDRGILNLQYITSFDDLLKKHKAKGSKGYFYVAVLFVYRSGLVDTSNLTKRIRENFSMFEDRFASVESVVRCIENAYNYRVPAANRVYLVDEYRKAVDSTRVIKKVDDK